LAPEPVFDPEADREFPAESLPKKSEPISEVFGARAKSLKGCTCLDLAVPHARCGKLFRELSYF
jgi:hypothetical protein